MTDIGFLAKFDLKQNNSCMQTLRDIFYAHEGRLVHKWDHYLDVYEYYFERFRGREVNLLEIGVSQGGSIQMWKSYFGEGLNIYSVDINPACSAFEGDTRKLFIGSQEDPEFLAKLSRELPLMDIIIDDGGHTMKQQTMTFESLFLKLRENGIYLVEDTHTSYWSAFGGGYRRRSSFIEYSKRLVDSLYLDHVVKANGIPDNEIARNILSISFRDSIVVFVKGARPKPFHVQRGQGLIKDLHTVPSPSLWERIKGRFTRNDDATFEKNRGGAG